MTTTRQDKLLLVEDDSELAALMSEYLQGKNYAVEIEDDGDRAIARILSQQPDLVVLDLMLPGLDGISICREVRHQGFQQSILMLTASNDTVDQILGLEIGADDFVQKPVEPRVLLARIRTLLRRNQQQILLTTEQQLAHTVSQPASSEDESIMQFGHLVIDSHSRAVTQDDSLIDLSTPEFDALLYMAENAGKIVSRDELFRQLRNLEYDGQSRFIDITVSYIRKKLGPESGNRLKTVRGKGYLFVAR